MPRKPSVSDSDLLDRLADKFTVGDDCWEWFATTSGGGYGRIRVNGILEYAHRILYQIFVGSIPTGLDLDHLCHNEAVQRGECTGGPTCKHRRCVRPSHLEPATRSLNSSRGKTGSSTAARNQAKTHCPSDHPYSGDNLYVASSGDRHCLTCMRLRDVGRNRG
jgi:hypothetical protein